MSAGFHSTRAVLLYVWGTSGVPGLLGIPGGGDRGAEGGVEGRGGEDEGWVKGRMKVGWRGEEGKVEGR